MYVEAVWREEGLEASCPFPPLLKLTPLHSKKQLVSIPWGMRTPTESLERADSNKIRIVVMV